MSNEAMPFSVWWINDAGEYNARGYRSQRAAVRVYNQFRRSREFRECGWETTDRQHAWFRATDDK
jgi:hypothetical protein